MTNATPSFWLLNSRLGWQTHSHPNIAILSRDGLRLDSARANGKATGPLSLAWLDDSLGGVTMPKGMAFDDDGQLYLVGLDEPCIKRYEPTARAFVSLAGITARRIVGEKVVTDRRTLTRPTGLAISNRKMYVSDEGEKRIQVFALDPPYPLLHLWGPYTRDFRAPSSEDEQAWKPVDVAATDSGVYILDANYRRILVHRPGHDLLRELVGELPANGNWTRIAADRDGHIYVLDEREEQVTVFDAQGNRLRVESESGSIRDDFDPPLIRLRYDSAKDLRPVGRFCLPDTLIWCGRSAAKPPPVETALALCRPPRTGTDPNVYLFERSDFKDLARFAARLRRPCDPLARYVRSRFSAATRKLLDAFTPGLPVDALLERALLDESNALVLGPLLFEEARFADVPLTADTQQLITQTPADAELARLNRLLLEQGFSLELRRCPAATPGGLVFNRSGNRPNRLPDEPPGPSLYSRTGVWISEMLDSYRARCQWHRVEIEPAGALPPGCQIIIRTFGADNPDAPVPVEQSDWALAGTFVGLPQASDATADEPRDVLVQSREGRFLRLQIELHGDGYATPEIRAVRVYYPRESYLDYLPAIYREDAQSQWFLQRFLHIFQTEWDKLDDTIDSITALLDPAAVPASFLAYLASWVALPLEGDWNEEQRRALLKVVPQVYKARGTPSSLTLFLQTYLQNISGILPQGPSAFPFLVEGFRERNRIILGGTREAQLDRQALLWGPAQVGRLQLDVYATEGDVRLVSSGDPQRDVFTEYANRFRIYVPAAWIRSAKDEQMLRRAIEAEKPAQTDYDLCLVEARFQVGVQSTVGVNTILGDYPIARLTCPHEAETPPPSRPARGRLGYDMLLGSPPQPTETIRI